MIINEIYANQLEKSVKIEAYASDETIQHNIFCEHFINSLKIEKKIATFIEVSAKD